eukprot:5436106-Prymnesium_polylepis.1
MSIAALADALNAFYDSKVEDEDTVASAADALAEAARKLINKAKAEDEKVFNEDARLMTRRTRTRTQANGSGSLDICILGRRTFDFEGTAYITVQNAFQAQNAQPAERKNFANVLPTEA